MNQKQLEYQVSSIHSQDEEWEKGHFHIQWNGLNDLVAETVIENPKDTKFVNECIILARAMRKELLKRYDMIFFGRQERLQKSFFEVIS